MSIDAVDSLCLMWMRWTSSVCSYAFRLEAAPFFSLKDNLGSQQHGLLCSHALGRHECQHNSLTCRIVVAMRTRFRA